MTNHGLTSALTRYRARNLTLSQAAAQAGVSESEFVDQLECRGITVDESEMERALGGDSPSARAD